MLDLKSKYGNTFEEFMLEVQRGNVDGVRIGFVTGFNTNVTTSIGSMWNPGGLYPYNLGFGDDADFIKVTSDAGATDAGIVFTITGLDSTGVKFFEEVILDASGVGVSLLKYSRFNQAENNGSVDFVGTINVTTNTGDNPVAEFYAEEQRSMVCIRTIPKGHTGYIQCTSFSAGSGKEGIGYLAYRKGSKGISTGSAGFIASDKVPVFEQVIKTERPFQIFEELTDVELRVKTTLSSTEIGGSFCMIVIRND